MPTLAIVIILIAAETAAFIALCLSVRPDEHSMGLIYISWMIVPALTTAIGTVNHRWGPIATVVTSLLSVACWNWLLLVRGLFWDDGYDRETLAIIYAMIGTVIGILCAGIVGVIREAVESSSASGRGPRVVIAIRKGASFGFLCSFVAASIFFVLGQPSISGARPNVDKAREQARRQAAVVSIALILVGTIGTTAVGALVGQIYCPRSLQSPRGPNRD